MNWTTLWLRLFGTSQWLGMDVGFWVSMGVVTLLVAVMNVVFWGMKPAKTILHNDKDPQHETE